MSPTVRRASSADLDLLAPLFDRYRHFYTQRFDEAVSRAFIAERLQRGDSVLLLATLDGSDGAGFTQLYPTFSSVRAARVWVLNDLFVESRARRRGVAQALLNAAADFARADGAARLELETNHDNQTAQALYDAAGWQRFDGTQRYHLPLGAT
ncbi:MULTISPECIES: GNAT family N-acetyltransferase [unclassified Lysobacter]|uniref:GNAT family N-acetyltransferase n=1 Tax=unclassified Lysobacter TaxID=2635362 RepID=UPI001BE6A294|nr:MULTISPECIES: GNAT family N-acetyltransferase [unclassified Lysobacter]MBT2747788.1 GNAT family N-acetyltransferase [Lysobacter sp. ISL-42]MBT2751490.1 GNAT family N-acetyltransferase [Lysobacter sp. ISL-50]MBT2778201.1 GNAT family N-acetyltransferase [Lysobacter sp. ISL-54]MBT2782752.1 GNAT family N-acetyltransferase [Lysobacter sp. ISL-52]